MTVFAPCSLRIVALARPHRQIPDGWWEPEAVQHLRDGRTRAGLGAMQAASGG